MVTTSIRNHLADTGALDGIALPAAIDALLTGLEIQPIAPDGTETVKASFAATPLFLDLKLEPPGPAIPYLLRTGEPDAAFRLWLALAEVPPAKKLFDLIAGAPDLVLRPAIASVTAEAATLTETDGEVVIAGATLALLIEGKAPSVFMRFVPTIGVPDGLVQLTLARTAPGAAEGEASAPTAVLIGQTGFGFEAPDGLVIDQSNAASVPMIPDAAWQGLVIPRLLFYLPAAVPIFGKCRVQGRLEIGLSPSRGIAMTIAATVPPRDGWPALDVRIECIDPAATGLGGFAPSLVEVAMELPVDGFQEAVGGHGMLSFTAGRPLLARARFVRDPTSADGTTQLTLAIEGQGAEGLISVDAAAGMPAKLVVAAGAFATAIIADEGPPDNADGSGIAIHFILLAALGATTFLQDKGKLVLHDVELVTEGRGLPLGAALRFRLDYSVDVMVKPIGIGSLSVEMKDEQPMRVRMREVVLGFNPDKSGLAKFSLDFGHAEMEVEDPGGWRVKGPESLFDILGTRSGRGSMWFEVDLAFRLDLGPVKVSGATLRATLVDGTAVVSIRGLDASLLVPALLDAKGGFQVRDTGISASLGASLIPLGASGLATLDVEQDDGTTMVLVNLDLDLPGPLPLAATGLALFGVGGTFGIFARPRSAGPDDDPVQFLLDWKPDRSGFEPSAGNMSIGVRVAVGTAADMGFTFGAIGGVVITVPDFALRGSISARMLAGRPRLVPNDQPITPNAGLSIVGAFLIDPQREVTFGLTGSFELPPLLSASIPVGGHFPVEKPSNWYINIGADGYPGASDRAGGPAKLRILPGTPLAKNVRGYLMVRGNGLDHFPYDPLHPPGGVFHGFVVAFGFSLEWNIGLKPFLWAEVHGGIDVLIAARPLVVAGRGCIGGSIHVGPLSVGVEATLHFILAPGSSAYVEAEICGEVDLWLTSIRKCVPFGIGDRPTIALPPPDVHPLDRLEGEEIVGDGAMLVDDAYRVIAPLGRDADTAPFAWPDAILLLQFPMAPRGQAVDAPQFDGIARPDQAEPIGSDRLRYWWTLHALSLARLHDDGGVETIAGPLHAGWQRGRFGDTTAAHEAAELALLTRERQLFTKRMPDGGRSVQNDPIAEQGRVCQIRVAAQPGWAIGGRARFLRERWKLPPDVISGDRSRSRVEADVRTPRVRRDKDEVEIPLHPFGVEEVPSGIDLFPSTTEPFPSESGTDPRFAGALWLDGGRRPGGSGGIPHASAAVRVNDTLHEGAIWLVAELDQTLSHRYLRIGFGSDEQQEPYKVMPLTGDFDSDPRCAILFRARTPFDRLKIYYPLDARIGILGIGGVTQAALDWAAAHNQAAAEEAAALAAAAAAGPQVDPITAAGMRSILEPGALYRIEVDLRWGAQMQKPQGGTDNIDDQTDYAPRNGGDTKALRQYYFRTYPLPEPSPPAATNIAIFDRRWHTLPSRDPFQPELIERHLLGYTPAQSEMAWFCDDPLEAHFAVDHVIALAKVYGYALTVGLRRVDVPGQPGELKLLAWTVVALTQPSLLQTAGSLYAYETATHSPCALPKPGMTVTAIEAMSSRAWYEVHVALESDRDGIPNTKLPGVTFRTSRYRDVAGLAEAVHFGFDAAGTRDGDVALTIDPATLTADIVIDDDLAFEDMLARIGLAGWPTTTEPRTSLLWHKAPDAGWRVAGVLIESAEPLHRAGRCELGALRLVMGSAGSATFDVVRRDRSASRVLYLTRAPFVPTQWRKGPRLPWVAQRRAAPRMITRAQPEAAIAGKQQFGEIGLGEIPRPMSEPRLELDIADARHDPGARTGKLTLPLAPNFAEEQA